jgi:NAD-dependent dihydropyrimidine dehydrogenase PreA subunit
LLPPNIRGLCIDRLQVTEVTDYREGSLQNPLRIEWAIPALPDRWGGNDERHEEVLPVADWDRCSGCASCVHVCRRGCLEVPLDFAVLQFPEKCNGEARCVLACPRDAIRMLWVRTAEEASHALGLQSVDHDGCWHAKPYFFRGSRCSQPDESEPKSMVQRAVEKRFAAEDCVIQRRRAG